MNYLEILNGIYTALLKRDAESYVRRRVVELMRLEIDFSRGAGNSIMLAQRHPLGFFACRWDLGGGRNLRLHLWNKDFGWAQEAGWEIHDHIFSFCSLVMSGRLNNKIYEIVNDRSLCGENGVVYEVVYDGSKSSMKIARPKVGIRLNSCSEESAGSFYSMSSGVLHSSELLSDKAVTILATNADFPVMSAPRVVSKHRRNWVDFDRSAMPKEYVSEVILEYMGYLAD